MYVTMYIYTCMHWLIQEQNRTAELRTELHSKMMNEREITEVKKDLSNLLFISIDDNLISVTTDSKWFEIRKGSIETEQWKTNEKVHVYRF